MHVCKRASPELEPYITQTHWQSPFGGQPGLSRAFAPAPLTNSTVSCYTHVCIYVCGYCILHRIQFGIRFDEELRVRINGHHHTLHVCTGTVTTVRSARRGWWWSTQCEMASYCIRVDPSVRPRRVLVGFNSLAFRRR